jgi:hypothetical protein
MATEEGRDWGRLGLNTVVYDKAVLLIALN